MTGKCPRFQWWAFGAAGLVAIAVIIAAVMTAKNNEYKDNAAASDAATNTLGSPSSPFAPIAAPSAPSASGPIMSPSGILVDPLEETMQPSGFPTATPTITPTTLMPTPSPTMSPTASSPTASPIKMTSAPSVETGSFPSSTPIVQPSMFSPTAALVSTQPSSSPPTGSDGGTPQEPTSSPTDASLTGTPQPTSSPTANPTDTPPTEPVSAMVQTTGPIVQRHEACFVAVNNKAYLIGGRGVKPVNEFDPQTGIWTTKSNTPIEIHHMQCVAVDDTFVYILNAWTGNFPYEQNVESIFVYDTTTDTWSSRVGLPEPRQRGGGSSVLVINPVDGTREIYVSHGNRGGHGVHSTALTWFDKYNVDLDRWTVNLPDAPNARDHTGGAIIVDENGSNNLLCVAGGRDSGVEGYINMPVLATDCYNFETGSWEVKEDIPQGRAGSAYGTTCDGKLVVAGGEGFGQAWDNVDVFDGTSWISITPLEQARHGTGLATLFCNGSCGGEILIASGSGNQGGGPELTTTERILGGASDLLNCN